MTAGRFKYGWIHENILRPICRPFWRLKRKWWRYRYIKKYGKTPEEVMQEFGRYVLIHEDKDER